MRPRLVSTEAHLKQVMLFNHMILLWVLNDQIDNKKQKNKIKNQIDSYNRYCKYFLKSLSRFKFK